MANVQGSTGTGAPFSAPWISRAAAIGLLLALLLLVYSLVVGPLIGAYSQVNGAIADANEALARYQRVAAQRTPLEGVFQRVAARQAESGIYLPGNTDALAAARLQEIVNARVETNGAQVRSVQILPAQEDGDFRRVGVRIQMTGNIAALTRILYSFEAGETFLFVDNLEISNRQRRRTRDSAEDVDPELLIRLDLSGYVQPDATG